MQHKYTKKNMVSLKEREKDAPKEEEEHDSKKKKETGKKALNTDSVM